MARAAIDAPSPETAPPLHRRSKSPLDAHDLCAGGGPGSSTTLLVLYRMYRAYGSAVSEEIPVTEARAQLSDLINRVGYGKERIVLTRHGKPLVALVPAEELEAVEAAAAPMTVVDLSSRSAQAQPFRLDVAAQSRDLPRS
jgi:prevent-host-death family protein